MKTPNLLDVPRDRPTKRERIRAFKELHTIQTHHCSDLDWMAGHLPSCRRLGYGVKDTDDLFQCASKVCRLMDEAGYVGYGKTEIIAIQNLCDSLNIPCDL